MYEFVFFRLSYFDYCDLQLFAIFMIRGRFFGDIPHGPSAENNVSKPQKFENFLREDTPRTPNKVRPFGTRDNAPLATALECIFKIDYGS